MRVHLQFSCFVFFMCVFKPKLEFRLCLVIPRTRCAIKSTLRTTMNRWRWAKGIKSRYIKPQHSFQMAFSQSRMLLPTKSTHTKIMLLFVCFFFFTIFVMIAKPLHTHTQFEQCTVRKSCNCGAWKYTNEYIFRIKLRIEGTCRNLKKKKYKSIYK